MTGTAGAARESRRGSAGFFSSAETFFLPGGAQIDPGVAAGYPIDLRVKPPDAAWTPPWLPDRSHVLSVDVAQWGLACFERHLAGQSGDWLEAARACGDYLLAEQDAGGNWAHLILQALLGATAVAVSDGPGPRREPPGAAARRHRREAMGGGIGQPGPRSAVGPECRRRGTGATRGRAFPRGVPDQARSFALNGAVFALWGRDVGVGLGDADARRRWDEGLDTLATNLNRWDPGWWSRCALYPHPVVNPASSFNHALHIGQLRAIEALAPCPEITGTRERFEAYAASPWCRRRAFVQKALFRLVVPRNRYLAFRLPWTRPRSA